MVSDELLTKKPFNELPPRVEYQLTDLGQKSVDVLWKLNDWGKLLVDKDEF